MEEILCLKFEKSFFKGNPYFRNLVHTVQKQAHRLVREVKPVFTNSPKTTNHHFHHSMVLPAEKNVYPQDPIIACQEEILQQF